MKDMILKSLDVGKRDSLPVKIIYDGKKGISERIILVKDIKDHRVFAYCKSRRKNRTFRLDGILAAEVLYGKS